MVCGGVGGTDYVFSGAQTEWGEVGGSRGWDGEMWPLSSMLLLGRRECLLPPRCCRVAATP